VGMWAVSLLVAAKLLRSLRSATILGTTTRVLGTTLGRAPLRAPVVALVALQSSPHSLWETSAPPRGASFFRAGTRPLAVAPEHRNASTPRPETTAPAMRTRVKRLRTYGCPMPSHKSAIGEAVAFKAWSVERPGEVYEVVSLFPHNERELECHIKSYNWANRFPLVVEAVNHLKVRSCLIDGEVVCCDERGVAVFHVLRRRRNEPQAFLYAFDLLELDGADMRREPLEVRKATLASILRQSRDGVRLNEHMEHPEGDVVFRHACKMGLEGIVSKRLGSRYRSGRSPDWLKFKNPHAPAVKREAEENWGR